MVVDRRLEGERMSTMGGLEQEHCEAILILADPKGWDTTVAWADAHGLSVMPMQAGMLLSGPLPILSAAFDVRLENQPLPVHLRVPDELRDYVRSIVVPTPPGYTSRRKG